jgi:sirohydrochlorin ferrochelatase
MTAEPEPPPDRGSPEPRHGTVRRRTGELGRRSTSAARFNLLFLRGIAARARDSAPPAPSGSSAPPGPAAAPGQNAGSANPVRLHGPVHSDRNRARKARRKAEPRALPLPSTGVPLIAVAHGTAEPAGVATISALLRRVAELRPGLEIRTAFLSVARPRLAGVLDEYASRAAAGPGCADSQYQRGRANPALSGGTAAGGEVAVVPLLLGTGYHVREDIPSVLDKVLDTALERLDPARPPLRIHRSRPLGPDPLLADVLRDRLAQVGGTVFGTQLVLAAAGSTSHEANADAVAIAGELAERLGMPVRTAFVSGTGPSVAEVLGRLARRGRPIAVAMYLLAEGEFSRRILDSATLAALEAESRSPIRVAAPLGAHDQVARLILRRYDAALARAADR